ncbi:MAG: class II glutamine amidotransferase [Candidatus Sedimenticola sp. (ex Thyasira tokunagai)]
MCELFAMSSLEPASVSFSLDEFSLHGGVSGPHKDGWGIAFYEGMDAKIIREAGSAAASPYIDFLRDHPHTSRIAIAHIRLATQGGNDLQNSQPFSRELGGCVHLFAHNGDLDGIEQNERFSLSRFLPIGETDSEYAFCYLMGLMQPLWQDGIIPSLDDRLAVISNFAELIRPLGPANFVYSDSQYLFVHGHKRTQAVSDKIEPPGLYLLHRACSIPQKAKEITGLNMTYNTRAQEVVLVASVPLSDESWRPLDEGEILVLEQGGVKRSVKTHE